MTFRETLVNKLHSISAITSLVDEAIYVGEIPETRDLGRDGPALTWVVLSNPRGSELARLDGTSRARLQIASWAYQREVTDAISIALVNALCKMPIGTWGDGTCPIMSVVHEDETDEAMAPLAGTDQWTYSTVNEFSIRYRVPIP